MDKGLAIIAIEGGHESKAGASAFAVTLNGVDESSLAPSETL